VGKAAQPRWERPAERGISAAHTAFPNALQPSLKVRAHGDGVPERRVRVRRDLGGRPRRGGPEGVAAGLAERE
jgi:hypothetical protein